MIGRPISLPPWTRVAGRVAAVVGIVLLTVPISDDRFVTATGKGEVLHFHSVAELEAYYRSIGYTVAALRQGKLRVPRIYLTRIPENWADDASLASKKSVFFRTLLPLILRVNETVLQSRRRLLGLARRSGGEGMIGADALWLARLAKSYRLAGGEGTDAPGTLSAEARRSLIGRLLVRVDAVPVSLALGQAAIESGYATSRFAAKGNALFGQWKWGSGMTPSERAPGASDYRVAAFPTPLDSARAYLRNLNTHRAYARFRQLRAEQRGAGKPLDGPALAKTLIPYAQTGTAYVVTLRKIIRDNRLDHLDGVSLVDAGSTRVVPVAPGG